MRSGSGKPGAVYVQGRSHVQEKLACVSAFLPACCQAAAVLLLLATRIATYGNPVVASEQAGHLARVSSLVSFTLLFALYNAVYTLANDIWPLQYTRKSTSMRSRAPHQHR